MVRCCRCGEVKPLKEFNYRNKKLQIRQKACRTCTRLELRNHYSRNREYYLQKAHKRNKENRTLIKEYIWNFLQSHPCVDCGEDDLTVLEFDHVKGKNFTIARLSRDHTLQAVKDEIDKCEVRCANCHRRKTAREFGWRKRLQKPL